MSRSPELPLPACPSPMPAAARSSSSTRCCLWSCDQRRASSATKLCPQPAWLCAEDVGSIPAQFRNDRQGQRQRSRQAGRDPASREQRQLPPPSLPQKTGRSRAQTQHHPPAEHHVNSEAPHACVGANPAAQAVVGLTPQLTRAPPLLLAGETSWHPSPNAHRCTGLPAAAPHSCRSMAASPQPPFGGGAGCGGAPFAAL